LHESAESGKQKADTAVAKKVVSAFCFPLSGLEFGMARNFLIAIFWIATISIFLMVAPKASQPQVFTSRRTDLVGQPLYDDRQERVGTVAEVVVDVERGDVEYIIVRVEQTRAFASRSDTRNGTYIVIPWLSVLPQHQANGFTLTVEQRKVQNAPRLSTLPDTTQAGWDTGLGEAWQ
jgi:sporulation protein YlmC with PRC-barrel domain